MKRSKKSWFLIIFFIWATLKSGGSIYGYEAVTDYAILSSVGAPWAFFVINLVVMALEFSTAIFLICRKSIAYLSGIALSVVASISGIIVTFLSIKNIDIVKSLYISSREAKGMTVNHEQLGVMFSQQGLLVMLLAYIAFYVFIVFLLSRINKESAVIAGA